MAGSGVNLANAYVTITPTTKGIQGALDSAFGGAEASGQKAGDSSGQGFVSRLGSTLGKGALAVGAAAGGVLSAALFKGWGRLTNIENATAKLTGLGMSAATVKQVMDNALASVKGTAFGLDEAATVSAMAVASGIKPGQQLEGVLKTVADTATIAGSSMSDMGLIFGSVAARGKLQGDDLMQLQSRGVPVLQFLAKHYGITAEAASEMVTKGKVDFENFNAAMTENLGGAALKSGDTTVGAFKNMGAALSRFGAKLAAPIFPLAKQLFGGITGVLDDLGAKAGPVIDKVGAKLGPAFARVGQAASGLFALFAKGDVTGGLTKALGVEEDSKVIDTLLRVRDAALGVFNGLREALPKVIDGAKNLWATFGPVVEMFGKLAIGTLLAAWEKAGPVISGVGSAFKAVTGFLKDNKTIVGALAVSVGAAVAAFKLWKLGIAAWSAVTNAATAVQVAFNAVMDANPVMLVVLAVAALAAGLVYAWTHSETFRNVVIGVFNAIKTVIGAVVGWIVGAWQATWSAVTGFFSGFASVTMGILSGIGSFFVAIWTGIKTAVLAVVGFLVAAVVGYFQLWWLVVSTVLGAIWTVITTVWNAIVGAVTVAVNAVSSVVSSVWNGIRNTVTSVVGGIKDVVVGAWNWIVDTGRNILGGLADIVRGAFEAAVGGIKSVINGAIGILNGAIHFINSKLIDTANKIPFVNIPHIPDIPRLAQGGIVPATPGGVLAFLGEGGQDELVLPRSKARALLGGGGGPQVTLNVYPRQEIDVPALARQIQRELAWGTT